MAATPKRPADGVQHAWALMQRFVEAHNRRGELADALGFRLGGGRGKILLQLRDASMTLSQLAESNGIDAPYTTLVVDKLEAHGLVERRPHPDDRRRKLVSLTTAGHDAITTADAILLRPPSAVATLAADDLAHLTEILGRLLAADEATAGSGPGSNEAKSVARTGDRVRAGNEPRTKARTQAGNRPRTEVEDNSKNEKQNER